MTTTSTLGLAAINPLKVLKCGIPGRFESLTGSAVATRWKLADCAMAFKC